MERSRRIRYRDYWARRAFGSRVIFDLSCVSIATVMDLMVYAACSPVRRRPASDLITFGNKSIPEMPVHGHDPQSIPEVWAWPLEVGASGDRRDWTGRVSTAGPRGKEGTQSGRDSDVRNVEIPSGPGAGCLVGRP